MSVQAIAWVLANSRSTGATRCVLISVANHVNPDGSGWVYVERVCKEANCSINSYHRAISWAEENGELTRNQYEGGFERTHSRHRPNLYSFPALCPPQDGGEGGTQIGEEGGTQIGDHNSKAVSKAVSKPNKNVVELGQIDERESAERILAAWVIATGRDALRTRLTKDRLAKIRARFVEGFSELDLIHAVQGIALSDFHMGKNPKGQRYDDLTIALRDGSQVEKFRDLYVDGPTKSQPKGFDSIVSALNRVESGSLPLKALGDGRP
jgi:hypothetical protein